LRYVHTPKAEYCNLSDEWQIKKSLPRRGALRGCLQYRAERGLIIMKFNFKKIVSGLTSTALVGSTIALAAAASFPAPFVDGGAADYAMVYGSNFDLSAVSTVSASLSAATTSTGGSSGGSTPTGGDFVKLDKSSNHLNIRDAITGPFGSTVDDEDLEELLGDGEYVADDSDTFSYEQKITLGANTLSHFRDSDYEEQQGLNDKTPTVGINISDGDFILNYTLDFLDQAESDEVSGDFEDFEGSDLPLFGKNFYISDWKNGTSATQAGKLTLLDSASSTVLKEGETVTLTVDGVTYTVSLDFLSTTEVIINVNGVPTNSLNEGETHRLSSGAFIGIRDILQRDVAGALGSVEFSIGAGKLELTHGSDVKINDVSINDMKVYMYKGSANGGKSIDKIELEWKAEDDLFITPNSEVKMPGFNAIKFTMNDLVRSPEEKITVEKGGDTDAQLTVPIKDGNAEINLLFGNASADFVGLGEGQGEWLATSKTRTLHFIEKWGGSNFHKWVVVSYNSTNDAESYLLSFKANEDTSDGRNETTIKNEITGETWDNRVAGDIFDLGNAQIFINSVFVNGSDEYVNISAGSSATDTTTETSFHYVFSDGGLMINLPVLINNQTGVIHGAINISGGAAKAFNGATENTNIDHLDWVHNLKHATSSSTQSNFSNTAGAGFSSFNLTADGENKDDDLMAGTGFDLTFDQTSSNAVQVNQVQGAGTGGPRGLENEAIGNNVYETFVLDDAAPRILHYTDPDEDYAEIYYPTGDSETYGEVFITDVSAGSGSGETGSLSVMDSELQSSGMSGKNLVIVGGTCVNSAAASLLGVSSPTCGSAWTSASGAGPGEFVIQSWSNPWAASKVATLVAGYEQADTQSAATYLTTQSVSTDVGKKFKGTTATGTTTMVDEA
jgi:hypothetical protein